MDKDNELMLRLQSGDKQVFEILVIKHRQKAIFFANNIVSNLDFAEDIVQECFAKIYINRNLYKPTYTFKTYLYTLIRNQCIDTLRFSKYNCNISLDEISNISNGLKIDEYLIQKDEINHLLTLINSLSNSYKTALYLFAVDELSYKEIAKITNKTIPQVKIIIFRARKKIKQLTEEVNNNEITTGISERSME